VADAPEVLLLLLILLLSSEALALHLCLTAGVLPLLLLLLPQ
jgi:hypothetical protein